MKLVLNSSYEHISKKGNEIHSALVNDVGSLTVASLSIIDFISSAVIAVSCFVYMAFLSFPLFIATLFVSVSGALIYSWSSKKNSALFTESRALEDHFIKHFNSILNGFKEIQISPFKGKSIYKDKILPIAHQSSENNVKAYKNFLNNQITGQVVFYILIGLILVVFSVKLDIEPLVTVNFIFILFYLLGAIESILVLLPSLFQAKVSLERIRELEAELTMYSSDAEDQSEEDQSEVIFNHLEVRDLQYHYGDPSKIDEAFDIGPISTNFNREDIVFIYGGNGSGKTTFIHVVLGLLKHQKGVIRFNDEELTNENYNSYKRLFSVVFNDFFLFEEFYGNLNFDQKEADDYLKLFEIEDKVQITDVGFSNTDLSTGQRKRLALIAALLENKPIIVLDEWAADQDPVFRKKFYLEILPLLKNKGFTFIAITHDDMYYSYCDKLFKMVDGKIIDETKMK
jgi:cyclic peptide transporter